MPAPRAGLAARAGLAGILLAAALTGCVAGDTDDPGGSPRRDLAVRPSSLPPETAPPSAAASSAPPSGAPSGSSDRSSAPGVPGSSSSAPVGSGTSADPGAPGGPGGSAAPGAAFRRVGRTADRAGDAGAGVPGYADVVAVTVEDDGTNARLTVTMNADVPLRLPSSETMGVGVDLFRTAAQVESDYQVFADGEPDGWFAYLQGPKGFVRYPGTFGVGGRRLVFTLPWSALGGPRSGRFSAFADWTRRAVPANLAGEDHAPDLGNAAFSR